MKHVAASLRLVLGPCPRSALSCAGRGARRCAWWAWGPSPARGGAAN